MQNGLDFKVESIQDPNSKMIVVMEDRIIHVLVEFIVFDHDVGCNGAEKTIFC